MERDGRFYMYMLEGGGRNKKKKGKCRGREIEFHNRNHRSRNERKKKRFQIEGFRDVYICNNNTILLLWGDRNSSAYTQHTQKRREEN